VSDRWLKGERKLLLQGMGMLAMGSLVILLLMPPGTSYVVLAAVIVLFGMSGLSWGGVYQTLAVELASQASAGLGTGIATTLFQVGCRVTPPVRLLCRCHRGVHRVVGDAGLDSLPVVA
jgi:MFS family permease